MNSVMPVRPLRVLRYISSFSTHIWFDYEDNITLFIRQCKYDMTLVRLGTGISLNPSSIPFGTTEVGLTDMSYAYVINPGNTGRTIDTIYNSLEVFTFDPSVIGSVIPPEDSLELWIAFAPDSSTDYDDAIHLGISGSDLSLQVSGIGSGAYISLSEDTLNFGLWETGAQYPVRNFTFTNYGNNELLMMNIISTSPAFSIEADIFYILDPLEESESVGITFIPPTEGFYDEYIHVPSNAYNTGNDTASVFVSGGWKYTPAPVYDLTVGIEGVDAVLNWSPVDTSIYGNPITVDAYLVFFETDLYSDYEFLAGVSDNTYTHELVVQFSENMFYQVEAFIGDVGVLDAIVTGDEPLNRQEIYELLRKNH